MNKRLARMRRGARLRAHLRKLGAKRLIVHRTLRHIYAQIISSDHSTVLASASTVEKDIKSQLTVTGNKHAAVVVGHVIAQRALNNGVCNVSFDRSGFKYHGRVRALAEAAREYGMKF